MFKKCTSLHYIGFILSISAHALTHGSHSIFIPRQLSYNPIFENASVLDQNKGLHCWDYIFSAKPIYTQSVGNKFKKYFNICHKECMNVQEDGSGDIDSLWFKVISSFTISPPSKTFYSSNISFAPIRRTYGSLLYFALELPRALELSFNTALVGATNNMHMKEIHIQNPGIVPGYPNITQAFANADRCYGRICGNQSKVGLDDIQIKLIKHICSNETKQWDVYGLFGIPTGSGSKAHYLFEPLIGSKHVQLGLGTDFIWDAKKYECGKLSLQGELKWRYGLPGIERRSYDLCDNGQWSRYLLFVNESNKYLTFPAINALTLKTHVFPRNSLDLYFAAHWNVHNWNFEIGYDYWYRSAEKVSLASCAGFANSMGIADLPGIALSDPQSASNANISQAVQFEFLVGGPVFRRPLPDGIERGTNPIISDPTFVPVNICDLDLNSGAQPKSSSNSIYANIAYAYTIKNLPSRVGLNLAYEGGCGVNTPNNVSVWLNFDLSI